MPDTDTWTPPPPPAAATRLGHRPVWDPPAAMTSARRWTCSCGHAVLRCGSNTYGSATETECPDAPGDGGLPALIERVTYHLDHFQALGSGPTPPDVIDILGDSELLVSDLRELLRIAAGGHPSGMRPVSIQPGPSAAAALRMLEDGGTVPDGVVPGATVRVFTPFTGSWTGRVENVDGQVALVKCTDGPGGDGVAPGAALFIPAHSLRPITDGDPS